MSDPTHRTGGPPIGPPITPDDKAEMWWKPWLSASQVYNRLYWEAATTTGIARGVAIERRDKFYKENKAELEKFKERYRYF